MSTVVAPALAALLTELGTACEEIIERHFAEDAKKLSTRQALDVYAPISVRVHTIDGIVAKFYEEGIEFFPEEEEK